MQLQKLISALFALFFAFSCAQAAAQQDRLPDIGTAGGGALSIEREQIMGDLYMRQIRATAPLVADPVLAEYLRDLGLRLVREAEGIRFPFTFFWVNQKDINAFAFFGGHVGINTGLIAETRNESELASVISHEIVHVSQRHLARQIETSQNNGGLALAGVLGAIILGMVSPDLGMAALSGSIGGIQQSQLNYSRMFEQEADRIGMDILVRSGFDPQGAPAFFGRLAEKYRYSSKLPEMLRTHPLSENRIADTRQRADLLPSPINRDERRYWLAKYRVYARHLQSHTEQTFRQQLSANDPAIVAAARYGIAIVQLDRGDAEAAERTLAPLLAAEPRNPFFIDVQADILLKQQRYNEALAMLEQAYLRLPNEQTITLNYANVALEAGQAQLAVDLLRAYLQKESDNVLAIDLLANAYAKLGKTSEMYEQRAALYALYGNFDEAINNLHNAYKQNGSELEQRRLQARIDQLLDKKRQLAALQR